MGISKERLINLGVVAVTTNFFYGRFTEAIANGQNFPGWYIAGGLAYSLGAAADVASTVLLFEKSDRARRAGIETYAVESNPFLPDYPTRQDLLSKPQMVWEIVQGAFGILYPPLGIGIGIGRFTAAIQNTDIMLGIQEQIDQRREALQAVHRPITELRTAREILEGVLATKQSSINNQTPTDQVANFPVRNIREAIAVVGTDLMTRCLVVEDEGSYFITKPSRQNGADTTLTFSDLGRSNIESDADRYWDVSLSDGRTHARIFLQLAYKINNVIFVDFGNGSKSTAKPREDAISVQDFKRSLRGLKWVCANILEWEKPGIISARAV